MEQKHTPNSFVGYEREKETFKDKAMTPEEYERRVKATAKKHKI